MKNLKIIFKIIIISLAFFVGGNFVYAESGLSVEFQTNPLFSEANFVPKESVTKYVRVTNNSSGNQVVVTSSINPASCSGSPCLSEAINLVIKKGTTELFNDTLEIFLTGNVAVLGNLGNGSMAQYDFIATFRPEAGNEYQALSTGFDLLIGFQGGDYTEDGGETIVTSGGGGGGGNGPIPGLVIKNEASILVSFSSVIIQWETSFPSTSQVIYREEGESYSLDIFAPRYGYPRAYPEPEDGQKVLDHSLTIYNLIPGKVYYYRVVSHASPATIGREHSFRMPTEKEIIESGFLASNSILGGIDSFGDVPEEFIQNDNGFGPESDSFDGQTSTSSESAIKETEDLAKKQSDNLALVTFTNLPDKLFGISIWWWILLIILIVWFIFWIRIRNE